MAFGQQSQHRHVVFDRDRTQTPFARATTATERASWRSVLERCSLSNNRTRAANAGGTSTTVLTGRHELRHEQGAGAGGALDRPQPRLVATGPRQQPVALVSVGDERELVADLFVVVEHDRGCDPRCGSIPMMNITLSAFHVVVVVPRRAVLMRV